MFELKFFSGMLPLLPWGCFCLNAYNWDWQLFAGHFFRNASSNRTLLELRGLLGDIYKPILSLAIGYYLLAAGELAIPWLDMKL